MMLLVKTYLATSKIHGIGLFADQDIPKGTIVWELNPIIDIKLTEEQMSSLSVHSKEQISKYSYIHNGMHILCGDDARFFNHNDDANCSEADPAITVTLRDIQKGEELTCNYNYFDPSTSNIDWIT